VSAGGPGVAILTAAADLLGEGLLWDGGADRLRWVDIERRLLRSRGADGSERHTRLAQRPTALVPRAGGGLLVALEGGIAELDAPDALDAAPRMRVALEPDEPATRVNDAKCGPDGRLFTGTLHEQGAERACALYRIDHEFGVTRAVDDVTLSNGLGWSPDGATLYYVDTMTHGVDAFDYDVRDGTLRDRRRLVDVAPADGLPDGMTIDADGCLWVALWGGGAVRRYTPSGELAQIVALPASQITNCCFGGPELRDLYITSARTGLTAERLAAEPHAGALFRVRPGAAGLPAAAFGPAAP
jgi:sugar lactone lactonase YvrE